MNKNELRNALIEIVGTQNVSDNAMDKYLYSTGGRPSALIQMVGEDWYGVEPDFIVWPLETEHVKKIIQLANKVGVYIVPWGGSAADRGGCIPIKEHTIVLDMKKMDKIKEINEEAMTVTMQPGIFLEVADKELEKRGYWTAFRPHSYWSSTIGGFLSTAGAGVFAPKYGYAGDRVLALEAVLPSGEVFRSRSVMKHSAGPNLNWLFIGSGGILGIITEITMKIYPCPEELLFLISAFPTFSTAFSAGYEIIKKNLRPCVLRVYDEGRVLELRKTFQLPEEKQNWLIMGFDGPKDLVKVSEKLALEICAQKGGKAIDGKIGERYWKGLFDFYRRRKSSDRTINTITTFVTFDKALLLYSKIRDIFTKYQALYGIRIAHFLSHGVSLYCQFHFPITPEGYQLRRKIWDETIGVIQDFGSTVEHHHEIGFTLGKYMAKELGYGLEMTRLIKKAFDPKNILNPGKLGIEGGSYVS